jgi:hypothetical protein
MLMAISSSNKRSSPKSDHHQIAAYNAIMTCLAARGPSVDLQILNNEASMEYKEAITFKWNPKFQLVPPDMHRQNWAERAICTFNDHFLAIVAGVNFAFPPYLWDLLLPQAELTLNLLHQATLNPRITTLAMWVPTQHPWNSSSFSSTVYSRKKVHTLAPSTLRTSTLIRPCPSRNNCIKILDIPQEFINEYKLTGLDWDGWIYFEIRQGCYGLPQAGIIANNLL